MRLSPSANPIISWLTSEQPPVQWLIPELLPQDYFVTLIADAGAGKSTLSYTLGMALATGTSVLGRTPVAPRTVLYFDCENAKPDMIAYARRAWIGLGRPNLELLEQHFWLEHFTLGGGRDAQGHLTWPQTLTARVTATQPSLIIIDTAISCCPPATLKGEDDNADAIRTINKLREIMHLVSPSASCLVLKHAKIFPAKEKGYDLRGAKAWLGAADSVLFLEKVALNQRGSHGTRLFALKSRSAGLTDDINIRPTWLEERTGLRLDLAPFLAEPLVP